VAKKMHRLCRHHKIMNYKFKKIFFIFFVVLSTVYCLLTTSLSPAYAVDLQVPLRYPGGSLEKLDVCTDSGSQIECDGISKYAVAVVKWLIGAVGILVMVVFSWAGILWLLARGDSGMVNQAQKLLRDGIAGLVLTLGSYLILWTINPNLADLRPIFLKKIDPIEFEYDPLVRTGGGGMTGASGNTLEYNKKPCPTVEEARNGFQVLFTSYYKPPPGDAGAYGDFFCNVSMQCSCPNGYSSRICSHGGHACADFDPHTTTYCGSTPGGGPQEGKTLAVDTNCFYVGNYTQNAEQYHQYYDKNLPKVYKYRNPKTAIRRERCRFTIDGIPGKEFIGQDTGAAIWGRHFDYFAGGDIRNGLSGVRNIKVLNPEDCLVQ